MRYFLRPSLAAIGVFIFVLLNGCVLLHKNIKPLSPKDDLRVLDCQHFAEIGEWEMAEAACDLCLAAYPNNSDCLNAQGTVLYPKDNQKGKDLFEKAIRYNKENHAAYNNLGAVYAFEGNENKAAENFKKAHEIKPDYFDALFNHAFVLIKLEDYDRALVLLNRAKLSAGDRDLTKVESLRNAVIRFKGE